MPGKTEQRKTDFIYRDGKPVAVILDINIYREMLERLEDMEDMKTLENMRKHTLEFREIDDVFKEFTPDV